LDPSIGSRPAKVALQVSLMISEQACSTEMHRLAVTQTKNTNASTDYVHVWGAHGVVRPRSS